MSDAEPPVACTEVVAEGVSFDAALLAKLNLVVPSFATMLPLRSRSVPVTMLVSVPLPVTVVGAAVHVMFVAGPKTVMGAEAVSDPAVATTLQGCVDEFVAVAVKRPDEVTAPHPPLTVQVTLVPDGPPEVLNCWLPPTGSDAEVGEIVSEAVDGTVICQKMP